MTGEERLRSVFMEARRRGRGVFLPFMTAGLPSPESSPGVFAALAGAGADGFEVGIPYTDPLMDGPVIQRGSDLAIAAGTTLDRSMQIVREVTEGTGLPALAMTYANPVFHRGVDRFCGELADAGAGGVIVPDLPVDEAGPLRQAASRHGLGLVLFVAPTSGDERIAAVAAADPVFVYAVAELGVTGERSEVSSHLEKLTARIRAVTEAPVVFGVGIGTPAQAAAAALLGDGVIVGSAMVRRVLEAASPDEAARSVAGVAAEFAEAVHRRG